MTFGMLLKRALPLVVLFAATCAGFLAKEPAQFYSLIDLFSGLIASAAGGLLVITGISATLLAFGLYYAAIGAALLGWVGVAVLIVVAPSESGGWMMRKLAWLRLREMNDAEWESGRWIDAFCLAFAIVAFERLYSVVPAPGLDVGKIGGSEFWLVMLLVATLTGVPFVARVLAWDRYGYRRGVVAITRLHMAGSNRPPE